MQNFEEPVSLAAILRDRRTLAHGAIAVIVAVVMVMGRIVAGAVTMGDK